jgi:tetratricopeptide (TPR) repeat protein
LSAGEDESLLKLRAKAYGQWWDKDSLPETILQQNLKKSMDLYSQSDDKIQLARAQVNYGLILADDMPNNPHPVDFASGISLIKEGITILEQYNDPLILGDIYRFKAVLAHRQKDYDTYQTMIDQAQASFEQAGDILTCARVNYSRAQFALERSDYKTAKRLFEWCRDYFRNINDKILWGGSSAWLGVIAYYQEYFAQAENLYRQALVAFQDTGVWLGPVWITRLLATAILHTGQIERAKKTFLESQYKGRKLSTGDKPGDPYGDLAFVIWMGVLAARIGRPVLAARFLGAVEAILESFFKPLDDYDKREYNLIVSKLRSTLDEATFTSAWAEGRKLSLQAVQEEALAFCHEEE